MKMSVPIVCDFPLNQEIVSCIHQLRKVRLAQYKTQLENIDATTECVAEQMGLDSVPQGMKEDVTKTILHWQRTLEAYPKTIHIDEIEFLIDLVSDDPDFIWPQV